MKTFYVCAALLTSFIACSKKSDDATPPEPPPVDNAIPELKVTVTGPQRNTGYSKDGDATYSFLGYGYDVTGKCADTSSVRLPIVDINAFVAAQPERLDIGRSSILGTRGYGMADAFQFASSQMTPATNMPASGGSVTAYFPGNASFDAGNVYAFYERYLYHRQIKLNAYGSLLVPYTTSSFKQDAQSMTPAQLVSKYGTHVMLGVVTGAKFKITYQAKSTTEAKGIGRNFVADQGFTRILRDVFKTQPYYLDSLKASDLKTLSDQKIVYDIVGGDFTKVKLDATGKVPQVNYTEWANNLTESSYRFVDFTTSSLIPIADLIDNTAKKQEVAAYILSYGILHEVKLN